MRKLKAKVSTENQYLKPNAANLVREKPVVSTNGSLGDGCQREVHVSREVNIAHLIINENTIIVEPMKHHIFGQIR